MEELKLVAIVGSLRSASVNRAIERAASSRMPDGVALILHPIANVPLYNGDVEERGIPESVIQLHDAVAGANGIIFFTPEYNSSLPAVSKNVIDWLSRPPQSWDGKAVTAVSATPGGRAGAGVLGHFVDIMTHLPVRLFEETHGIGNYPEKLDESGELADAEALRDLASFLERFAAFARTPF